jgi:oligopeptide/dipeptide ABC transporter ATP-binding protein
MTTALSVRGLRVTYGAAPGPAVDGVDLDVPERGSVALVGESGSGKSTLALAITRLLPRSAEVCASELSVFDADMLRLPARELRALRRTTVAMVFQDPRASWNPTRTISAQLLDGLHGDERRKRRARLVEVMRRVGIGEPAQRIDDFPHHYSGGMLQRAMLAGGLADHPRLLIADEPTSALDTTVQAELLSLIDELRVEQGLSLLLISHDLGVVGRMASEIVVLFAGRVVERGPTDVLLRAPQHPYTRELIAATPRMHGPRKVPLQVGNGRGAAKTGCSYAPRCAFAAEVCLRETPALRSLGSVQVACVRAPIERAESGA